MTQAVVALFFLGLWATAIIGYIKNIIKLVGLDSFDSLETIVRVIGIVAMPAGSVLGWL